VTIPADPHFCPTPETLVLFLEGRLTDTARETVAEHAKTCSECIFVLGETHRFLQEQEDVATEDEPPSVFRKRSWWPAAATILIAVAGASTWTWLQRDPIRRLVIVTRSAPVRQLEGRLDDFRYARFEAPRTSSFEAKDTFAVIRAVAASIADDPDLKDAAGFHARGVAELLRGNQRSAVALLIRAVQSMPSKAGYWADLAAARISAARGEHSDAQLLAAVADADRALALDPRHAPAFFNRAVALQNLGRSNEAIADFRRAAALERRSPWSKEALRRAEDLLR
jgi:tetratricopeptide (TPR) repeat protein